MSSKTQRIDLPVIGSVSTRSLSIGFLVFVAAGYSLLSVGSRLLSEGFQPMTQVYMRVTLGTILAILLLRKSIRWHRMISIPQKDLLVLLSMGTIGFSIAVYFITQAVLNAKLINVAVIFASVPFFSYIYAYIFLKKKFDVKLVGLLGVSLLGIAIVATKSYIPQLSAFGIGEWFALISTATMAWFYVGRKLLSSYLNTSEITIVVMVIAAVSAFLLALLRGETLALTAFVDPQVLLGLLIGGGLNAVINPIEIFAFKHLDSVIGSQVLLLDNVFAFIFGYFFYQELVSAPEVVGSVIIIGSVYFANKLTGHDA